MRIQGQDLREKNRVKLQEVVPLDTPMLMYLEPTNLCNLQCKFCPTSDHALIQSVKRPGGIMSWDLFVKIVDDLKKFPRPLKMINIYKDGEPLLNQNLPEMIRYLKDAGVTEKVWMKTNGLLLTPALNDRLVESGLDMIGISVIAPHDTGYEKHANKKVNYNYLGANIWDLHRRKKRPKIYVKMADVGFNQDEIDKFYRNFEEISDYIAVENLHGWSRTDLKDFTLGKATDTFDGLPNKDKIVCPWTLYQMTVNWNGTVQPCNEDWSWINVVGDVRKENLVDIWNGKNLRAFQIMHLEGRRDESQACATCWQVMSQVDDVDKYRWKIREHINGTSNT